ncbi:MAG TPA: hypothetical protein VG675_13280 [Bryobacteraceae bacterium]|nr:hypothetical protein [Bryobacteraceae bacterium]
MFPTDVTAPMVQKFLDVPRLYAIDPEFEFGWWYSYFWKEAKSQVDARKEDLKTLMSQIYNAAQDTGKSALDVKQQMAPGSWFDGLKPPIKPPMRDYRKREILTTLLRMGFKAMPVAAISSDKAGPTGKKLFEEMLWIQKNNRQLPLAIGYRGVTTTYDQVLKYEGALNRVELKLLHMGDKWHPFSEDVYAKKMYYRLGSNDNCLYTVSSAADSAKIAVGFPLIEDENIFRLPAKPIKDWDAADFERCRQGNFPVSLAHVTCSVNSKVQDGVFLATESYLYLFRVTEDAQAVHTEDFLVGIDRKMAGQCQERGVRRIPLADFLAGLRLHRVHLGPQRTDGVVAFTEECKYQLGDKWVSDSAMTDDTFATEKFHGDKNAAAEFLIRFRKLYKSGPIQGERDYGAIKQDKPVVSTRKLAIPAGLAGMNQPVSSPVKFQINRTGQSAKVGSTEVRTGVSDRIEIQQIIKFGLNFLDLSQLKGSKKDLYFGRS